MKIIIASDIHGSAKWCGELVEAVKRENADKVFLLGDILYHGPRNPLPDDYNPQKVIAQLDEIKDKIRCVRGNCDAEVDLMVLPFKVFTLYTFEFIEGKKFLMAHGHYDHPAPQAGDIYLTGHTHVPLKEVGEYIHLNPGSVSLPKEGSGHSYILYEDNVFSFVDLESGVYDQLDI